MIEHMLIVDIDQFAEYECWYWKTWYIEATEFRFLFISISQKQFRHHFYIFIAFFSNKRRIQKEISIFII
jgi:hypothetical protein